MEAPEREYRYRLFSTPRVNYGQEVADFIGKQSRGVISVEESGDVSVTFDGPSGPYKKDAVRIMSGKKLFADGFSVVLLNDDTAAPLFQWDNYAVVSRGWVWVRRLELEGTDNPGIPVLAYLTLTAIANHELHKYLPNDFPQKLIKQGPFGWASLILSGRLPFLTFGKLPELRKSEREVNIFLSAVESVLRAIAERYPSLHAVPSSPQEPQQPTHEVKVQSQVGIEFSGGKSVDKPDESESDVIVEEIAEYFDGLGSELDDSEREALREIIKSELPLMSQEDSLALLIDSIRSETFEVISNLQSFIASADRPLSKELLESLQFEELDEKERKYQISKAIERDDRRDPFLKGPHFKDREQKKDDLPPTPTGAKVAAAMSEYDKPVDALGYQSYANALGDLIAHPKTGTPLTIAICGPWGSGKTTLMDYIKDRIKKVNEESDTEFIPLDFDAWTYSKSDAIWAPFYSAVLKGIEGSLGFWEKTWFRLSMRFKTERAKTTGWIAVGVVSLAIFAALLYTTLANTPTTGDPNATELKQVVTVFDPSEGTDSTATLVIREPKAKSLSPLSLDYWTLERLVGTVSSLFGFVIALVKILTSVSSGVLGKVKRSGEDLLPLAQEDVVKYVDNVRAWLKPRLDGGERKRFVVFVDDIDRVEPNKIMQMMEAIQLFLRTKGFVFVLCMDARVVRQAIGKHYSFMGTTYGDREWWGHHYLEKIIQIPFYLPRINLEGMMSLKEKLLGSFVIWPEPVPYQPSDDERPEPETDAGKTETEPTEAAADPAEQHPEQSGIPKASPPLPADPIVDDRMDMTLTVEEDSAFDKLFQDGLELSPRLLIRLKNVYLLARHVYLKSGADRQVPPVFTKWIALSVKYPFEVKELVETCTLIGWPPSWQEVFDTMAADPDSEKWKDLNKDHLETLAKLLPKHVPSPKDVQQFVAVTNCFNLVLD